MPVKIIMRILYLHIAQNLGGVEKRFATMYKYLLADPEGHNTVIMSRSFIRKATWMSLSEEPIANCGNW